MRTVIAITAINANDGVDSIRPGVRMSESILREALERIAKGDAIVAAGIALAALAQPVPAADVPGNKDCRACYDENWDASYGYPCPVCGTGLAPTVPTPVPWHDWHGGDCPVAGRVYVDVHTRGGKSCYNGRAQDYFWGRAQVKCDNDIIAWRYAAVTPVPAIQVQEPVNGGGYAECCNPDCDWFGVLSDTSYCGAVGPLCPRCREVTEPTQLYQWLLDHAAEEITRVGIHQFAQALKEAGQLAATPQPEQTAEAEVADMMAIAHLNGMEQGKKLAQQSNAPALSDEQIRKIIARISYGDGWDGDQWDMAVARAIESAILAAQGGKP